MERGKSQASSANLSLRELAFEASGVGISLLNAQGFFVEANQRYCEILGRNKEEILGKRPSDFNHPDDDKLEALALRQLQNGEIQVHFCEKRYVLKNGETTWVRIKAKGVLGSDGALQFFISSVEDINQQKRAEAKLFEAHQLLGDAEELAQVGNWIWNLADNSVLWSDAIFDIFGFRREDTKPSIELYLRAVHPNDRERMQSLVQSCLEGQDSFEVECRIVRTDGSVRMLRQRGSMIRDEAGRGLRMGGIAQDVTELFTLAGRIRESEWHSRQILDAIPDLVLVKGPKSRLLWANKAFRDYYGMTNEELRGIIDAPFNEPDYTEQYVKDDSLVFHSGKTLDIPSEPVMRQDGAVRMFHTVKSPIFDESGQVTMTVGVSRDITDRLEAERLLDQQRARMIASSKMSALGEMAGGVAHEINNPLAIIMGNASQLREAASRAGNADSLLLEGLERIEFTSQRIAKIVKGLRSFSRSAEFDPAVPCSIAQIVEDTLELCRERFKSRHIQLEIGAMPLDRIECRPSEISQVLLNLLSNAYDAVQEAENPWVRLECAVEGENLELDVTDSGHGIPGNVAARMMEPFFTTKDVGEGTGLGLSIAKGLVEGHGGSLVYCNQEQHTRFRVILPLRQRGRVQAKRHTPGASQGVGL